MIPFLVTVLTERMVFSRDWFGVGVGVGEILNQKRTTTTRTTKKRY